MSEDVSTEHLQPMSRVRTCSTARLYSQEREEEGEEESQEDFGYGHIVLYTHHKASHEKDKEEAWKPHPYPHQLAWVRRVLYQLCIAFI